MILESKHVEIKKLKGNKVNPLFRIVLLEVLLITIALPSTMLAQTVAPAPTETPPQEELAAPSELHTGEEFVKAFALPEDSPDRPNVLLIGDSISIGYTVPVRKLLKDKVDVFRVPTNCRYAAFGLEHLDKWLGEETKWDVIHFNWGLWDLCYRNPESKTQGHRDKIDGTLTATPEQYRETLEKIVKRLKETEAKLIWCATTPVPDNELGRKKGDALKYNAIAKEIMDANGVVMNDLHSHALLKLPEIQSKKGNVHFTKKGYAHLAKKVAADLAKILGIQMDQPGDDPQQTAQPKKTTDFAPNQAETINTRPADAIVLFDGEKLQFSSMSGGKSNWKIENKELISTNRKNNVNHIVSQFHFRDADIHVEFKTNERGAGNSGIYIHGNYELQIHNIDPKKTKLTQHDVGALYGFSKPLVAAGKPAGQWQVYDIRYIAPRRNAKNEITEDGEITAWLNGKKVQSGTTFGEPKSVYHPFRYGTTDYLQKIWKQQKATSVGPLFLQDHNNPVKFRNVWIKPLDDKAIRYRDGS